MKKRSRLPNSAKRIPYCFTDIFLNRAKISEEIEQKYGDHSRKGLTEKQLVPKAYHDYLDTILQKIKQTDFPNQGNGTTK
jgi:hypothetical protein